MTHRTWFSRLLRHPARKRSGSILTTPEPARGLESTGRSLVLNCCGSTFGDRERVWQPDGF